MKKLHQSLIIFSMLFTSSLWAVGFGHGGVGHFPGPAGHFFPSPIPISHGPGFFPGHPGIIHPPGYAGPRFGGWGPGYVRHYGFPLWYAVHESARYAFDWDHLKEVTCTAQAADGQPFSYTAVWGLSWGEQEVQQAENAALMECDQGSNGARGCFLAGCTPIY